MKSRITEKIALVQLVAPILFRFDLLPERNLATSNYASYPTPQVDASRVYAWSCYPVVGRFIQSELILNRLIAVSSSYPIRGYRFYSQSEALTSLLAQDWCRHVVGSFLSSCPKTSTVSRASAPRLCNLVQSIVINFSMYQKIVQNVFSRE